MDLNEALEIVGALVDRIGDGDESEAMGIVSTELDRLRALATAAIAWYEDAEEFTAEHALMDAIRAVRGEAAVTPAPNVTTDR